MLKEQDVTVGDRQYRISQLPLGPSQEVFMYLTKLLKDGVDEASLATLPAKLTNADVNYLRDKLLGTYCQFLNENDKWVPMGKALVEEHFAGHLGYLFKLLGHFLLVNYRSFFADLDLEALVGEVQLAG